VFDPGRIGKAHQGKKKRFTGDINTVV